MEVNEMKKLLQFCLTLAMLLLLSADSRAYVVDADLSDWGVTPLADLSPTSPSTIDHVIMDNINTYNAYSYSEAFDFEAMYFDDDADYLYIAVISSSDLTNGGYLTGAGSLGIHLGAVDITEHGVVNTYLEYAIGPHEVTQGHLLLNPTWVDTHRYQWPGEGWQNTPWWAEGGTDLGSIFIAHARVDLEEVIWGLDTSILELAIPKSLLPQLLAGDLVSVHLAQWCGNDGINLTGIIDIPEPATLIFLGFGLVSIITKRRK